MEIEQIKEAIKKIVDDISNDELLAFIHTYINALTTQSQN